jgi:hypothetical protein
MKMNRLKLALMGVVVLWLVAFGVYSLVDTDQTTSVVENRLLTQRPAFSWAALADGSYTEELATYYADQFPLREKFMAANRTMNQFYYYTGDDNTLIISFDGADAVQGGNAVVTDASDEPTAAETPEATQTVTIQAPETEEAVTEPEVDATDDEPEDTAESGSEDTHTYPSEDDAFSPTDSSILIVGDRAMDLPFASYDIIDLYADAVDQIATTLGEQVRTISLVTPNSGEFYSPESFHTGNYSQKDMIDYCYSKMHGVITVDAYSKLYDHTDDYIYFRTDHHWTALGAYYAYTAFCEAAGFTPVALSKFETGRYDEFVGTMYTYTSSYPQSQALLDNPDYVDYYLPIVEAHAKYYTDSSLENGIAINVVSTNLTSSNKYLCFISGDTPICEITTDVTGPICVVLKDSYGNAMVPFLTSHYSKIYVIDPREFNTEDTPELNLATFAAENNVDDVIIINYPFMINNKYYTKLLDHLVTDPDTWYE